MKQPTRKQALFRLKLFLTFIFLVFASLYPLSCWERGWAVNWFYPCVMLVVYFVWMFGMDKIMQLPPYAPQRIPQQLEFDFDEKKE